MARLNASTARFQKMVGKATIAKGPGLGLLRLDKGVLGERQLQANLGKLKKTAAKRAVQQGLSKAAQYSLKVVKGRVASRYKDVRKSLGWRALKRSQNKNEPGAKVGAAVGKRGAKYYRTTSRNRGGRPGVGFGEQNVHWWFMGTKYRDTKMGHWTGIFPPQDEPIAETLRLQHQQIAKIIRIWTDVGIAKEVAKMKK